MPRSEALFHRCSVLLDREVVSTTAEQLGGLVKIEESVERINQTLNENEVHPDELALYLDTLLPFERVVYEEAQRRLTQTAKPVRTRLALASSV